MFLNCAETDLYRYLIDIDIKLIRKFTKEVSNSSTRSAQYSIHSIPQKFQTDKIYSDHNKVLKDLR